VVAWRTHDSKAITQLTSCHFKCQLNHTSSCLQIQKSGSMSNRCHLGSPPQSIKCPVLKTISKQNIILIQYNSPLLLSWVLFYQSIFFTDHVRSGPQIRIFGAKFVTGRTPFLLPNNSVKALKSNISPSLL